MPNRDVCVVEEGFQGGSTRRAVACANFYQGMYYPNEMVPDNTVHGSITILEGTTLDDTHGIFSGAIGRTWCLI